MKINLSVIEQLDQFCERYQAKWIAVTKMQSVDTIRMVYNLGKKRFGENRAQELIPKYETLPQDIEWHFIGHLQTNKVRQIIDKVDCIHSVDSAKLLSEIQKEAAKINRNIDVFIQIHIADEESKYGFSAEEAWDFFENIALEDYTNIRILGLMAMASLTVNKEKVRAEFETVQRLFREINQAGRIKLTELSMGMSQDYEIALECGSTCLRIGSILYDQ